MWTPGLKWKEKGMIPRRIRIIVVSRLCPQVKIFWGWSKIIIVNLAVSWKDEWCWGGKFVIWERGESAQSKHITSHRLIIPHFSNLRWLGPCWYLRQSLHFIPILITWSCQKIYVAWHLYRVMSSILLREKTWVDTLASSRVEPVAWPSKVPPQ